MTYTKIINPKNGKYVSINTCLGEYLLQEYILAHNTTNKKIFPNYARIIKYQLFTDIDDTLHPSNYGILSQIAGKDIYISGGYYPGVKELHRKFYYKYGLPSVIVTANPFKKHNILSGSYITNKIKNLTNVLHGENTAQKVVYYAGDYFKSVFDTVTSFANNCYSIFFTKDSNNNNMFENMADCKFNQIQEHILNEIEIGKKNGYIYRAIWIGDNSKGDLYTAIKLIKNNLIDVAFIHYVDPFKHSGKEYNEIKLDYMGLFRGNIVPFITYIDVIKFLINEMGLMWLNNINLDTIRY